MASVAWSQWAHLRHTYFQESYVADSRHGIGIEMCIYQFKADILVASELCLRSHIKILTKLALMRAYDGENSLKMVNISKVKTN